MLRGARSDVIFPGAEYTPDEVAFLQAVDVYKRRTGHKFPSLIELLDVLRELGWRPPERPAALPPTEDEPTVPTVAPTREHRNFGVQRNSRRKPPVRLIS